jgi:hypothetical protein
MFRDSLEVVHLIRGYFRTLWGFLLCIILSWVLFTGYHCCFYCCFLFRVLCLLLGF